MPSTRPRMALTLSPELHATIHDLADAMGKPAATVVTGLLEEMAPQLEGIAKVARAAKAGNKVAAKRAIQHMLGDAFADVMAATQPDLFGKKGGK